MIIAWASVCVCVTLLSYSMLKIPRKLSGLPLFFLLLFFHYFRNLLIILIVSFLCCLLWWWCVWCVCACTAVSCQMCDHQHTCMHSVCADFTVYGVDTMRCRDTMLCATNLGAWELHNDSHGRRSHTTLWQLDVSLNCIFCEARSIYQLLPISIVSLAVQLCTCLSILLDRNSLSVSTERLVRRTQKTCSTTDKDIGWGNNLNSMHEHHTDWACCWTFTAGIEPSYFAPLGKGIILARKKIPQKKLLRQGLLRPAGWQWLWELQRGQPLVCSTSSLEMWKKSKSRLYGFAARRPAVLFQSKFGIWVSSHQRFAMSDLQASFRLTMLDQFLVWGALYAA